MNKTFARWYTIILYEEDENYTKYVENLKKYYKIYAYILHDKDKLETGETKKPHYHYIITTGKNPERIKTLSKTTEIPINYIERMQQRLYVIIFNTLQRTRKISI